MSIFQCPLEASYIIDVNFSVSTGGTSIIDVNFSVSSVTRINHVNISVSTVANIIDVNILVSTGGKLHNRCRLFSVHCN